jgi:hypothetical protein
MKRIIFLLALCITAFSCQTEELVVNNAPQDNLAADAALAGKLKRMAQYPTAVDNVVDGTACFSVQMPFTVTVNAQTVMVDGTEDYQTIRNIIDQNNSDNDIVVIQFPVNVTYADYTGTTIANQAQFNEAVSGCVGSIELSCINLVFPLEINTYNIQDQLGQTFDLGTEEALFEFIQTLNLYDAVAFDYPISFTAPNGSVLSIANNDELEAAIDSYTDECLDALIPGPDPETPFEEVITSGTWYVSYFFRDQDDTEDYEDYDFTFNTNGTINITGGSSAITGNWATFTDDGELELDLTFSSSALSELAEDWTVVNFTATVIELQKVSGGGDEIRYLTFTRN